MSFSSDGDSPYTSEESHANALLRGIDLAVDDVIGSPDRDITRLEQEKLCYFAINKFDIPITYSWYLSGPYTKVAGEPDNAPGPMERGSPDLSRDRGLNHEVQRYRDYFASEEFFNEYDLEGIWYQNKFSFLYDFYETFAEDRAL